MWTTLAKAPDLEGNLVARRVRAVWKTTNAWDGKKLDVAKN
jgi:hypothetical protein